MVRLVSAPRLRRESMVPAQAHAFQRTPWQLVDGSQEQLMAKLVRLGRCWAEFRISRSPVARMA